MCASTLGVSKSDLRCGRVLFTMFKRVFEELKREVSGEIAFNHVAEVSRYHRIQVSPGIREAVNYANRDLRGLWAYLLTFGDTSQTVRL